jgi:hypothetical protein
MLNHPFAVERVVSTGPRFPAGWIRRLAASGRGAHCGSGGTRSTGQVGPATIRPAIPDSPAVAEANPPAESTPSPAITPITDARRTATA